MPRLDPLDDERQPKPKPRPTFKQQWPAYNLAQTNEKAHFQTLLHELCRGIEEPIQKMGRPRVLITDLIYCAALKAYTMLSGRRHMSELRQAQEKGYISKAIHYNTISKYLEREDLTTYLTALITQASLPLKSVEVDFAVDSSGFSTGLCQRWVEAKWTKKRYKTKDWVKAHIMCGVKTNIITAVEVSHGHASDHSYFASLVEATSANFVMQEVSADKAYSSGKNLKLVVSKAAMPYIPFKSNATPSSKYGGSIWKRMFHLYNYNEAEFKSHYHKRSNVEATFSMIKRKFGERLRARTWNAQVNEVLCKILCHNICCCIHSMYELGVDLNFEKK
jgi:transposase